MSHVAKFPAKNLPHEFPKKLEDILKAIDGLAAAPELAIDTETTGLFWYMESFDVFYITLCDGLKAVGFEFPKVAGPVYKALKKKIFENPMQRHVYQNAKFDLLGLRKKGIEDLGEVHDTMILKALHDERDVKHLEAMALKYLEAGVEKMTAPVEAWFKENNIKKDERRYDKVPMEIMGPYACQDTVVTWWLWKGLYPLIQENEHWKKCYEEVELPCLRALVDMETAGYAVDVPMLKALEPELEAQAMTLEASMRALIAETLDVGGVASCEFAREFNFQSPDQLVDLFLEKFKVPRTALGTTESGKPSADWYALERVKGLSKDPAKPLPASSLATMLQDFSEKRKLIDTFIKGIDRSTVNGAIYGGFNQVGARTGRMSSSNPNMQNMPVEGPIRKGFICRPGFYNFFFDWKQIEMAILAHYCEDETMLEALENGQDLHTATAAVLFDKKPEDVTKEERAAAKTINFAIVYGAGQGRVAQQLGWDLAKAKELLVKYNAKFPGVRDFRERAGRVARQRGWVKTYWGRYRHIEPDKHYIAVNSIVQGTATGDLTKIGLARVCNFLKRACSGDAAKARIISVVHDEYHTEIPIGREKVLVPEIKRLLEDWAFRVPVVAEVSWTQTNWGDKVPYELKPA